MSSLLNTQLSALFILSIAAISPLAQNNTQYKLDKNSIFGKSNTAFNNEITILGLRTNIEF